MRIYRIRKVPLRLILLALIIFILIRPNIFPKFKSFSFNLLSRPFSLISGFKEYFTNAKLSAEENFLLKHRVADLSVELARLESMEHENENLKALLAFKKSNPYMTIGAKVIVRDVDNWSRFVVINKGKKDGVKERMACATAEGLVGSVIEAGQDSSKVMLITDPNSRLGVIVGPAEEAALLEGASEEGCRIAYISVDENIKEGEHILTGGFSRYFPRGIVVGEVVKVATERTGLYKYAIVKPAADIDSFEYIICIDKPDSR